MPSKVHGWEGHFPYNGCMLVKLGLNVLKKSEQNTFL